ncbi:MAG: cache domain-containing protein, partial [Rhodocyclaceae bacterium]|nr:cache domain-containing protein [Rhodocyclaceae bacterium]
PAQASILRANTMLESVYVGGPNGEYLNLREIKNQQDRERFAVGSDVLWLVQAQRTPDLPDAGQIRFGLDQDFRPLSRRNEAQAADYDPRTRPWYTLARGADHVVRTAPYQFFSSGRMGITLARDMGNGYVVAMDINMDSLSPNLKRLASKWSARFWLFDRNKRLIAGDQPEAEADPMLSDAMNAVPLGGAAGGRWIEDAEGASWWLGAARVHLDGRDDMELRHAIPRKVILGKAESVRDLLLAITVLMLAVMLFVTKRSALRFSRPLQAITEEAEAFVRFDFASRELIRSPMAEIEIVSTSFDTMRSTIERFMGFLDRIAREPDLEKLLPTLLDIFSRIVGAEAACLYLSEGERWVKKVETGGANADAMLQAWLGTAGQTPQARAWVYCKEQGTAALPLVGQREQLHGVMLFACPQGVAENQEKFAL